MNVICAAATACSTVLRRVVLAAITCKRADATGARPQASEQETLHGALPRWQLYWAV